MENVFLGNNIGMNTTNKRSIRQTPQTENQSLERKSPNVEDKKHLEEKFDEYQEYRKYIENRINELEMELKNLRFAKIGVMTELNLIKIEMKQSNNRDEDGNSYPVKKFNKHHEQVEVKENNSQQETQKSSIRKTIKPENKILVKCVRCGQQGHKSFECNKKINSQEENLRRKSMINKLEKKIEDIKDDQQLDQDEKLLQTKKMRSKIFFMKKEWKELDESIQPSMNIQDRSTGKAILGKTRTSKTSMEDKKEKPKEAERIQQKPKEAERIQQKPKEDERIQQQMENPSREKPSTGSYSKEEWNKPFPEVIIQQSNLRTQEQQEDWDKQDIEDLHTKKEELDVDENLELIPERETGGKSSMKNESIESDDEDLGNKNQDNCSDNNNQQELENKNKLKQVVVNHNPSLTVGSINSKMDSEIKVEDKATHRVKSFNNHPQGKELEDEIKSQESKTTSSDENKKTSGNSNGKTSGNMERSTDLEEVGINNSVDLRKSNQGKLRDVDQRNNKRNKKKSKKKSQEKVKAL